MWTSLGVFCFKLVQFWIKYIYIYTISRHNLQSVYILQFAFQYGSRVQQDNSGPWCLVNNLDGMSGHLAIRPSTRSFQDNRKWVFHNGTYRQTHIQTHKRTWQLYDWPGPESRVSENLVDSNNIFYCCCWRFGCFEDEQKTVWASLSRDHKHLFCKGTGIAHTPK